MFPSILNLKDSINMFAIKLCRKTTIFSILIFISIIGCGKNVDNENSKSTTVYTDDGWTKVEKILESISAPSFPDRDFVITDYGAVADGKTFTTEAFRKAIDACNKAGGGRVVVPQGTFFTGAIHLKSNVNLYISKNATVLFSENPADYKPLVLTRFEGVECMNYSPFVYAYDQQNIAISGSGTLDGSASKENWWVWKGRKEYGWDEGKEHGNDNVNKLYQMAEDGTAVADRIFGDGYHIRPNFIQLYKCKNVLLDSINIKRSPMWVIHPVLSENVTVQNVNVASHGPNNDGCNPESSKNVLIRNCSFDTGDDCIAIKSGRNADGRRLKVASENIIVRDCFMKDGHGGVVIGSEMSGGVKNVFIENCTMDSPNLERALRIKTNSLRGGVVENVYMRHCNIVQVKEAVIKVNFYYSEGDAGEFTPSVKNIYIDDITSKKSKYAIFLEGYERSPIDNLVIQNCKFDGVSQDNHLNNYTNLKLTNVFINGEIQ
jgi:polygalacturonase